MQFGSTKHESWTNNATKKSEHGEGTNKEYKKRQNILRQVQTTHIKKSRLSIRLNFDVL